MCRRVRASARPVVWRKGPRMLSESNRASPGHRVLLWTTALLCGSIALLGRLVYQRHPWDGDAGMFVVSGRALANGARFCHEIYDNKFPTAALWSGLWWRGCG